MAGRGCRPPRPLSQDWERGDRIVTASGSPSPKVGRGGRGVRAAPCSPFVTMPQLICLLTHCSMALVAGADVHPLHVTVTVTLWDVLSGLFG